MIQIRTKGMAGNKVLSSSLLLLALMASCLLLTAKPAHAETFAVNSTGDGGDQAPSGVCNTAPFPVGTEPECTLRAAIQEANATTTADTISFNIGGSGVKTIAPMTALPDITQPVTIDGYSEPGARPNTLDTGSDAVLKIELSGASAGAGAIGLRITGPDSVVRGLIINRFGFGISMSGGGLLGGRNKIEGNYIGTDPTGTLDRGNSRDGVIMSNAGSNVVGGASAAARNVISGNNLDGVSVDEGGSHRIEGNYVGTDASGTQDLGNGEDGVTLLNAGSNVVGGTSAAARNVISGNGNDGVTIASTGPPSSQSAVNKVMGNYIGTDVFGTRGLGNSSDGVVIEGGVGTVGAHDNTIGGTEAGAGGQAVGAPNVISSNGSFGVAISGAGAFSNSILSNSIYSNGALGIDLGGNNGVTANDPKDADIGPNNLQNYPVITSVIISSGQTTIKGTLDSIPNRPFALQFFASPTADPSGFGEGRTLVGETVVNTDSSGDASFDLATATPLAGGQVVSATATVNGNTSEFSRAVTVVGNTPPNTKPTVTPLSPRPGARARDTTPLIRARVTDTQTNLAKANVRLFVDGKRKGAFAYNASTDTLSLTSGKLKARRHTVRIVATDAGGLSVTKVWSFRVVQKKR